jgi:transcriptional regulator with XRE-family HTH domain
MNAQRIRERCQELRLTYKEVATRIGITPTGMQTIFKENSTSTRTIEKISEALGVHPGYFFDDFKKVKIPEAYNKKYGSPLVSDGIAMYDNNEVEIMRKYASALERIESLQGENYALRERLAKK